MDDDGSPSAAEAVSAGLEDRLSELPDSLIILILSLLPIMDVVRTSILSKRWKHIWTTIPFLDFIDDRNDCVRFHNFVNAFLALWNGTKIIKFNLDYLYEDRYLDSRGRSDLDSWLNLAIEKEVNEVHINLLGSEDIREEFEGGRYSPPQPLYSCSSITKLSLEFCDLRINGNVQWNQLKSLRMYNYRLSEEVIIQIVSGCPQLEVLDICHGDIYENMNIHSSSLKELRIEKYLNLYEDDPAARMGTVLAIWAPKLEALQIEGCLYDRYSLTDVSSLTNVALHFTSFTNVALQFSSSRTNPQYQGREEMMIQLFQSILHVQTITLSPWCTQCLGMMKWKGVVFSANAKFLNLCDRELQNIVNVLQMFPKLTELVLKLHDPHSYLSMKDILEHGCTLEGTYKQHNSFEYTPDCSPFLEQLRRVEITWVDNDDSIDRFIEFLREHGCTLEEIVFNQISSEKVYIPLAKRACIWD